MKTNPIVRFIRELTFNGLESAIGRYYSSYRGIVADNADPAGLGRVQLIIPEITGNEIHEYWALPKNQFAGKGYGSKITPQKGELVWVEFEHGKVEVPIFSLGYHGTGELPEDEDCKDPNVYWFFSPKGHKVKINDTKNYISIESRFGDKVELTEKGIALVVDTKKKRQISLGKTGKSDYKAVKGEKVKEAMESMMKANEALNTALQASTVGPGAFLTKAAITTALPQVNNLLKKSLASLDESLSDIVTLE